MIDQTVKGHADAPDQAAEVIRLTDPQRARLAMYVEQFTRAQAALNEAFANILIGRGVDLDEYEVRLSPDGAAALLVRTSPPAGAAQEGALTSP